MIVNGTSGVRCFCTTALSGRVGYRSVITLEGGEVVIYDVNDEAAWVQSEAAVSLELIA